MEHEELLNRFTGLVDRYAKHREYIARARAQEGKFSKAVIEKVCLDHEVKSSEVADEVRPLVPDLEAAIAGIDEEIARIEAERSGNDERMQELELRLAIEELTQEQFEAESAELKASLDQANARLEELRSEREALSGALDRWVGLAKEAGHDTGVAPAADEEVGVGVHTSTTPIREDVSAAVEEQEPIEAGEVELGVDFEEEVELNLVDGAAAEVGEEVGIALEGEAAPEEEVAADEQPRRALLIYQEGTPEEQIYPVTGEVLSIGRGRDNDIQIKNDSKVSRFHCKLYRRGGHYYIEDNKSSNGTLVNGELVQERRLFGGEEIVIGETFFRFRIM